MLGAWESRWVLAVQAPSAPWIDALALAWTALGLYTTLPLWLLLAGAWDRWVRRAHPPRPDAHLPKDPRAALELLIGIALGALAITALKAGIAHPRPAAVLGEAVRQLEVAGSPHSFPSAHAAVAGLLAAVSAARLPSTWRWLPWGLALGVAWTRLRLGMHFPSDVVAGLGVGACSAGVARAILRWWGRRRARA